MSKYAGLTRVVQPRLAAVAGVQRIEIFGARTFAMRIWLKPERMAALGISPSQVRDALAADNYLAATGSTKGALVQTTLAGAVTISGGRADPVTASSSSTRSSSPG